MPDEVAESSSDEHAAFVALVDLLLSVSRRELQDARDIESGLTEESLIG
jgi:hypothetical protein